MIVATVLTVVLAVTFKSTTETQITRLEEESQKTLSAAEAGVEAAIQQAVGSSVSIASLPGFSGTGFTGQATVGAVPESIFVSSLLRKDQQYTFYLSDYPGFANPINGTLSLYFQSETDCPALELTFISTTNAVTRRLADPCDLVNKPSQDLASVSGSYSQSGYPFVYRTENIPVANQILLIVRTLFASTRVGLERVGGGNLPIQGKYVVSEARSPAGVAKKIQLFQSFPQIPAEFFVTSF